MTLEYQSPCSALKSYPAGGFVPLKKFCFRSAEPTSQPTHGDRTPYPVPVKTTALIVTHHLSRSGNTYVHTLYICIHTWKYTKSRWTHIGDDSSSSVWLVFRNLQPAVLFLTGNAILLGEYRTSPNSNTDRIRNYDTVGPSRNSLLKKLGPKC